MDLTQLKQLFTDEDAVSPVIGVILMVAITVILAAVIGTFVLGLGENVQDSAPQANFQFEYGSQGVNGVSYTTATITHTGGEDIDENTISVQVAGSTAWGVFEDGTTNKTITPFANAGTIQTGTSTTVVVYDDVIGNATDVEATAGNGINTAKVTALSGGDSVRVIWTSPSGGQSNTIGQSTVPN